MQLDPFTLLAWGVLFKVVLCATFFVYWLFDRRSHWYGWWSATFLFGTAAGLVFLLRGFKPEIGTIGLGGAAMLTAVACCWQGARAFDRRRPLWWGVVLPPALWLAVCLVPGFLENIRLRLVVVSLAAAGLIAMTAVELWRGRAEQLFSRWPAIVLSATLALTFGSRAVVVDLLPFPFGALPEQPNSLAVFNFLILLQALLLTVLMVSLPKERLELEQRTKAHTDPLTGALNRRALLARAERHLARHRHDGAPLCLLFLDLDHFKQLNDRLGHSAGDDVLVSFVRVINGSIRPMDDLFRVGGEEFCCLLPYTTTEQALRVAERIRHRVETAPLDVSGVPVQATVSIGLASTEVFGHDIDVLMRRADAAVYVAKRQGRNRVVIAGPATDLAGAEAKPAVPPAMAVAS